MKKALFFIVVMLMIVSCGDNALQSPSESDKIEIEVEKESIIEYWNGIMDLYYEMDDENLKKSFEYGLIKDKTKSKHKEVAEMAKSYLDSVDHLEMKILQSSYGSFFDYGEEQGWDKISKDELLKLENTFKVASDEFSSSTLYRHPASPKFVNYNGFFLYYSKSSSDLPNLYLRAQYRNDDWLFIREAKISIDGNVYHLNISDWKRDNEGGYIFEWGTEKVKYFNLLTHILRGNNIKIRYYGDKYHDDRVINSAQKGQLKDILKVYYGLYLKDYIKLPN